LPFKLNLYRYSQVLLGRHRGGDFEGRWTGFIEEVKPGEDPAAAAVRALALGGMRLDFDISPDAAAAVEEASQKKEGEASLSSSLARRRGGVVVERARLRFTGWLDVPVIEHEFTVQLDGDELEVRAVTGEGIEVVPGDGGVVGGVRLLRGAGGGGTAAAGVCGCCGVTLVGAPPLDGTGGGGGEGGDGGSGSGGDGGGSSGAPCQLAMEPRWFAEADVPYHEMPDDDQHWYPPALALAANMGTLATVPATVLATAEGWEVAREIIVGDFHFEGDELARHHLQTILTDA
jgi:hypothetical protein